MNNPMTNKQLPQGWQQVALEKIARIFAGSSAPQGEGSFSESGAPFVRVSDLGNCNASGVLEQTRDRLSEQAVAGCTLVKAPKGAVLFPKSGAAIATNRRAVLGMDAYIVGHLFALVADPESVTMEWLYSAMRQIDMMEHSDNVGYPSLKKSAVEKITIPLPPIAEQKRIVGVLNRKMAAVTMARAAALARVEAAQSLPAAWLREVFAFGGEGLPRGWHRVKLGAVSQIINGTTPSTSVSDYWNGSVVWVTPADMGKMDSHEIWTSRKKISREGLQSTRLRELPVGTVILSSRAPIGYVGVAKTPLCTNQGCKSFVLSDKIESEYLYFVLKFHVPDFEKLGSGSTYKEITKSKLAEFKIPLPPLAQQKRLVASLNAKMAATEKVRAAAEAQLEAVTALPAALLREAFSGTL